MTSHIYHWTWSVFVGWQAMRGPGDGPASRVERGKGWTVAEDIKLDHELKIHCGIKTKAVWEKIAEAMGLRTAGMGLNTGRGSECG